MANTFSFRAEIGPTCGGTEEHVNVTYIFTNEKNETETTSVLYTSKQLLADDGLPERLSIARTLVKNTLEEASVKNLSAARTAIDGKRWKI